MSGSLKAKSVDELVTTFSVSPPEDNALISPILNVAGVKQFDKVKSDIVLRDISLIDVGKWSRWEKTGRMNKELVVNENFKIYDVVKFIPERCFQGFADIVSEIRHNRDLDPTKAILAESL